MYAANLV